MTDSPWQFVTGDGPLVALALHDGGHLRDELRPLCALDDLGRQREEDPFTAGWTTVAPNRVVVRSSRFEVDVNRPRDKAVYRTPEDAWGLNVWKSPLAEEVIARSLARYDAFYQELHALYSRLAELHGRFVVLDLHTYNHCRSGPGTPPAELLANPEVNVGTGTLGNRARWARLIGRFMEDLAGFDFPGGRLDVRENVKFRGGHCARWTHETFPGAACVLSIEFKKTFMDEWTGVPDGLRLEAIAQALRATVAGLLEELAKV